MNDISKNTISIGAACLVLVAVIKFVFPLAQMKAAVDSNTSRIEYVHEDFDQTKKEVVEQKVDIGIIKAAVERIETTQALQPAIIEKIIKEAVQDLKE